MDKANAALAERLVGEGTPIHLVAHTIDERLRRHPLVSAHLVNRPAGSFLLGEQLLDRRGRAVARAARRSDPGAQVLVNGGNCLWPGINWSHYVHHAWNPEGAPGEPAWLRAKNTLNHALARRRERTAYSQAALIVTNSELTRRQILNYGLCPDPDRVRTIYLGSDPDWGVTTPEERAAARREWGLRGDRPVAAFVGALAFDHRKGFDTLFHAWRTLCAQPDWDADLLVAGGGGALDSWRAEVDKAGLNGRIRMLGFCSDVRRLLAASDLLISPVRYEAYGLNVQEAICRGVPAVVSRSAGVAEKYTEEIQEMLLEDPNDVLELTRSLLRWRPRVEEWKRRFDAPGARLRGYGWQEMAGRIVAAGMETAYSAGALATRTA